MKILPILITASFLLSACVSPKKQSLPVAKVEKITMPTLLADSAFGPAPAIIEAEALFRLNETQKSEFFAFAEQPQNIDKRPNRVIADYLKSHLQNYNYYSDTLSAEESLIKQQGNCLSLAILTKALANLHGVDISYQLVETTPVYQKEGNLILSSQHVRTKLFNPKQDLKHYSTFFVRGGVIIDYFPERGSHLLRRVEEKEFFGMYYRNKAAEAMIHDDLNRAFWLTKKTLSLNPNDPHGLNMMALIHSQKGEFGIAESLYQYGIKTNQDKMDLLSNYLILLKKMGKTDAAEKIAEELKDYNDLNPFKWISLANSAYNARNFEDALRFYKKAKRLAPYLHQPYAGIARSEYQLGDMDSAKEGLIKALENSHRKETKKLYQAKLDMLSQLLNKPHPD